MSKLSQQIIRSVPAEIKDAIVDEVDRRGTNMNDVVVGILADAYSVRFDLSGRTSGVIGDSPDIVLRLPRTLKRKIAVDAARQEREIREVVIEHVASALKVPLAA